MTQVFNIDHLIFLENINVLNRISGVMLYFHWFTEGLPQLIVEFFTIFLGSGLYLQKTMKASHF